MPDETAHDSNDELRTADDKRAAALRSASGGLSADAERAAGKTEAAHARASAAVTEAKESGRPVAELRAKPPAGRRPTPPSVAKG